VRAQETLRVLIVRVTRAKSPGVLLPRAEDTDGAAALSALSQLPAYAALFHEARVSAAAAPLQPDDRASLRRWVRAAVDEERRTYLTPASAERIKFIHKMYVAAFERDSALYVVWRAACSDAYRKGMMARCMHAACAFCVRWRASDVASCPMRCRAQAHAAPPAHAAAAEQLLPAPAPAAATAATLTSPAPHATSHPESFGACIVRALASDGANAAVSTACCHALLAKIEKDASCVDAACCVDAVTALVAVLQRHALFEPLQEAGWLLMSKLLSPAAEDVDSQTTTTPQNGLLHPALSCLRTHPACKDLVINVLNVLRIVMDDASIDAGPFPEPFPALLKEAVLAAMHAHLSSPDVQVRGLDVLLGCTESRATGCPFVLDAAVLHIAVAAMRGYSADAMMQDRACLLIIQQFNAMHEMDSAEGNDTWGPLHGACQFVGAGIIEAAIAALRTHRDDMQLANNLCGILYCVVHGHAEHAARAARAGALALRLPWGIGAEAQEWWSVLRLECEAAATADADAAMAALLAEEEAEREARGGVAVQSKKKAAAKRRGRSSAQAGDGAGNSEASSGAAQVQSTGTASAEGAHDVHGVAATAEDASTMDVSAPSASAERRRRRAATKAAKRAGNAPAGSAAPALVPADAAYESEMAAEAVEADAASADENSDASPSLLDALPTPPSVSVSPASTPSYAALSAQLTASRAATAELQAALASAEAEADAMRCVICMDAPRCCVVLPCRHLALCASPACAAMLGAQPARCPLCLRGVADTMQVFV
jgi:hypothetical protein